ncbi:chromosome partitioning protein ParB [Pseudochrobactrum sp. B5]|uniref:chromosome partitioning protein ParB n=1 Tax=Pseudochrobactrum sp. B5 TaxID=1289478 RepID=UPI000A82DF5D|nr:chromosome partitioning protein ParB [Pseudochrobactrum sp. B5]
MRKREMLSANQATIERSRRTNYSAPSDEGGTRRVNFQLAADLHRKLKIYAANSDKTITEILTEYVEQLPDTKEIER